MRKWMIRVFVYAIMLMPFAVPGQGAGGPVARAESQEPLMRVYFVPFDAVTYFPISMDDMGTGSPYAIWFVDPGPGVRHRKHPFISKLRRELQSRPVAGRQINDFAIRLRVDVGGETFFVDTRGTVLDKASGKTFRLTREQMRGIENTIISFSGVIDIHARKVVVLPE